MATETPASNARPYIVTGCINTKLSAPRLEIATLMDDDPIHQRQFSLFIRGLYALYKSWFIPEAIRWPELAGIHGVPYKKWSGDPAGGDAPREKGDWEGYCFHDSVLFPTWHRALMLTVEQAINEMGQRFVEQESYRMNPENLALWQKAANELRWPYWDWSNAEVGETGFPAVFQNKDVMILDWDGKTKVRFDEKYGNPLHCFVFDKIPKDAPPDDPETPLVHFTKWERTDGWATLESSPQPLPVDDYVQLNQALTESPPDPTYHTETVAILRSKLYSLFSYPLRAANDQDKSLYWNNFSNIGYQTQPGVQPPRFVWSSLEDPHNKIHLDIGGNGDMAFNEMAAYDPIFFFHHCNVDRLYALWEYIYPDYWMGDGWSDDKKNSHDWVNNGGTWDLGSDAALKQTSRLAPFRKDTGADYWNSIDTRGLQEGVGRNKYYSYEPLVIKFNGGSIVIDVTKPCTLADRVVYQWALQKLYDTKMFSIGRSAPRASSPIFRQVPKGVPGDYEVARGIREFYVIGTLSQYMLRMSYHLELYLDGAHVNEMSVFNRMVPERCGKCTNRENQEGGARVRVSMRLPHSIVHQVLLKYGKDDETTSDEEVIEVLKEHLTARIVAPDRTLLVGSERYHLALPHLPVPNGTLIALDKSPVLELTSAQILHPKDEEAQLPILHGAIAEHGIIETGRWRLVH
ncbi:hypothetical protein ABKN59_009367 [Abortiporus biennis]